MTPDTIEQGLWQFFGHLAIYFGIGVLVASASALGLYTIIFVLKAWVEWMLEENEWKGWEKLACTAMGAALGIWGLIRLFVHLRNSGNG